MNVLGLENEVIGVASKICGDLRMEGALIEDPDLLIASICVANRLPLVTGNSKHFERFRQHGLTIEPLKESMDAVSRG